MKRCSGLPRNWERRLGFDEEPKRQRAGTQRARPRNRRSAWNARPNGGGEVETEACPLGTVAGACHDVKDSRTSRNFKYSNDMAFSGRACCDNIYQQEINSRAAIWFQAFPPAASAGSRGQAEARD